MDRINIQMEPYQMKNPAKTILIVGGLFVTGLAIYKTFESHSATNILFIALGLTSILQGINPFNSKKLYLTISDSKIEYNLGNIGRPSTILVDDLQSVKYDDKRLRFDFMLNNGKIKKLYLRMLPKDRRAEIIKEINSVSIARAL